MSIANTLNKDSMPAPYITTLQKPLEVCLKQTAIVSWGLSFLLLSA